MRGEDWAGKIKERMQHAKKAIVVGGGYIGIEAPKPLPKPASIQHLWMTTIVLSTLI